MKSIQHTTLVHTSDASKTYQVELVKVENSEYIVVFKYGTKGEPLKEGNKTDAPVALSRAKRIFDNLVKYKIQKGYTPTSTTQTTSTTLTQEERQAQKNAILKRLSAWANGEGREGDWKLSRIIWRVGELGLTETIPDLLKVSTHGDSMTEYSIAWTLGRLRDERGLPILEKYYQETGSGTALSRICKEALLAVYKDEKRAEFLKEIKKKLPTGFAAVLKEKDTIKAVRWLWEQCYSKLKGATVLPNVYLFAADHPHIHAAIVELIKDLPFKPNHFKGVRYLFKAAEFRKDGKLYGLIAHRFEKTAEHTIRSGSSNVAYVRGSGMYIRDFKQEVKKKNSKVAYSDKTRAYMKRRVWRTLKRMGDANDPNYVKMAVGLLLPYDDASDYSKSYMTISWVYDRQAKRYYKTTNRFDEQAGFINLFHVLYGNSPRYTYKANAKGWTCTEDYRPGQPAPETREETFPHLWDQMPQGMIHLLAESKTQRVHDFAIKALKAHTNFEAIVKRIGANLIIKFLDKPFEDTNRFALELANNKYDANHPDKDLVLALLNASLEEAVATGKKWVNAQPNVFFSDTNFIKSLVLSPNTDTRKWIAKLLPVLPLDDNQQKVLIGRLLAYLLQLGTSSEDATSATEVSNILLETFARPLKNIGLNVIRDLVRHELAENQAFGGELLKNHKTPVEQIPEYLLQALLDAQNATVRKVGIELFGQFSDASLFEKEETLVNFCVSPLTDVRTAIRPIIKRLATKSADFGEMLVGQFAPMLLKKENYKGLHEDMRDLLLNDLEAHLHTIERKMIFRLLNSKRQPAQEMGVALVQKYVTADSLSVRNIIRLANHEMLSARHTAWRMFNESMGRMRYEREEAIRLLDSKWDDSREFAFKFFRKNFTEKDWTPEILVGICDSVRKDVQLFGKELITAFFKEENGTDYLLKLSQHPTSELQVFASQYLTKFASDNLDHLKKLELYFITVLSGVNKGRKAKNRTFEFLRTEAMKNAKTAEAVTQILNRISATAAIGDKASCIEILRDIKVKYPKMETQLEVVEVGGY